MSNAEDASSATAVTTMPAPASLPVFPSAGTSTSASILSAARALFWVTRSTAKVARIDSAEGSAKRGSHSSSGGMWAP